MSGSLHSCGTPITGCLNAPVRVRMVWCALLSTILLLSSCTGSQPPQISPIIELVESVPEETVLENPGIRNTQEVWLEMLRDAQHTIDIEQFYIANRSGEALEPVIREVLAAAARGVAVRVLTEEKFASVYPETLTRLRGTPRISVREIDFASVIGAGVQHSKFFVVDAVDVFVGSQNWDWRALSQINELGIRIHDSVVAAAFTTLFDFDWALAGGNETLDSDEAVEGISTDFPRLLHVAGSAIEVSPVFSPKLLMPPGAQWDADAIVCLLDDARDSVKLQVLSYGSYALLEDALLRAAGRGVRVSVLVSDWSLSKSRQKDLKRLQRVEGLTVKFTAIPEHRSGFISFARVEHCKYLLVDASVAWIGTNNWSSGYFRSSRNAGIILSSSSLCDQLHRKYAKSWDGPYATILDPDTEYTARTRDKGDGK